MTNLAYHTIIKASNEPEVIRRALVEKWGQKWEKWGQGEMGSGNGK